MDSFSLLQQYISAFGAALLLPLIWLMNRRGQRKIFPYFFIYLIVVLVKSAALLIIKPLSPIGYFYGFWTAEAITVLLSFGVIFEIYHHVLTSGTIPISKATFFTIAVILLLLSAVAAPFAVHAEGYSTLLRTIFVLTSTLRFIQVALFVLLSFFSVFYGFYWTGQAFGIALGYALFAFMQLANTLARVSTGTVGHWVYVYVSMLGYQCAVLIWLLYAAKGQQQPRLKSVPEIQTELWAGALERLAK
jgi:hypothetical protein